MHAAGKSLSIDQVAANRRSATAKLHGSLSATHPARASDHQIAAGPAPVAMSAPASIYLGLNS